MSCPYQHRSAPFRICNALMDATRVDIRSGWHAPGDTRDTSTCPPAEAAAEAKFLFTAYGASAHNPYAEALIDEIASGKLTVTRGNAATMRRIGMDVYSGRSETDPTFRDNILRYAIHAGTLNSANPDSTFPTMHRLQTMPEEGTFQFADNHNGITTITARNIDDGTSPTHATWEIKVEQGNTDMSYNEWTTTLRMEAVGREPESLEVLQSFRSFAESHAEASPLSDRNDRMPWSRDMSDRIADAMHQHIPYEEDDYYQPVNDDDPDEPDPYDDEDYEPGGMTDVEADADTLASAGWGTDEDYGMYDDGGYGEY